jgi:hypothetical protein
MCRRKTYLSEIINNKEYAISKREEKTELDDPGEVELKFGFSQFFFDLGVLFQGELLGFLGRGRLLCHMGNSIALAKNSCNKNEA